MDSATWSLIVTVFAASVVEFVEAFTVVLAMGITRGWRSALTGALGAVIALAAFAAFAGYAVTEWLPEAELQLVIGALLLMFGLQWLRKAILRSAGLKALHDEEDEFIRQQAAAAGARSETRLGLDSFGTVISFKAVFLEGVEIVFIVITFGLNADNVPAAAIGAVAAGILVLSAGVVARVPLSRVPENTLKYGVGLLLATFGTFWAIEGAGLFAPDGESLHWLGGEVALPILLLIWIALSRALVGVLRSGQSSLPRPSRRRLA